MQLSQSSPKQLGLLISLLIAVIGIPASSFLQGLQNTRSLEYEGVDRNYLLYSSRSSDRQPAKPLIIALHDDGSSARNLVRISNGRLNKLAAENDFVVVYPEGLKKYWTMSSHTDFSGQEQHAGDVGFIKMLIESLKKEMPIDESRIFLTGMGSGGVLAIQLACEAPGVFRAIGVVTASLLEKNASYCDGALNTSLLLMNGSENPLMPYEGGRAQVMNGQAMNVLSTEATVGHWLKRNGCLYHGEKNLLPDVDTRDQTSVTRYTYSGCHSDVDVILYKIAGGGHTWPGGRQYMKEERIGRTSRDIEGASELMAFFGKY